MQHFALSDTVEAVYRQDLTVYGTIKKIDGASAVVHFKVPRVPKRHGVCDRCNFPGMLSRNGGSGEIECMRSGCGHEHGFDHRDEIIELTKLKNITTKRRDEKRKELSKQLLKLLEDGVAQKLITHPEYQKALSALPT